VLYDYGTRVYVSAASAPDDIYQVKAGLRVGEFSRTSSRLIEMASDTYLKAWQERQDAASLKIGQK
jgi:cell division protein ZapE